MKYLSEWDQWKRYSSKSWKRFLEKAREMTTHLELWRKDIRSIEGRAHLLSPSCAQADPGSVPTHLQSSLGQLRCGGGVGEWVGALDYLLGLLKISFQDKY